MNIPNGHQVLMPYLMLKDATKFAGFTQQVFNAILTFSGFREDQLTMMHAEIQINNNTIMFCDATESWKATNSNLFIYVEDADETYKKAMAAGAITIQEPHVESYGRTCGICDPCGITWWITSV